MNEQAQKKAMELAQQCSNKFCERWYWNPSSDVRSELAKEICETLNLPRLLATEAENAELRQRLIAEHLPEEYKSWEQVWNNIVTTQKELNQLRAELGQEKKWLRYAQEIEGKAHALFTDAFKAGDRLMHTPDTCNPLGFVQLLRAEVEKVRAGLNEATKAYDLTKAWGHRLDAQIQTFLSECDGLADGAPDATDLGKFCNQMIRLFNETSLKEARTLKGRNALLKKVAEAAKQARSLGYVMGDAIIDEALTALDEKGGGE